MLRIDKVLQGEVEAASDVYFKQNVKTKLPIDCGFIDLQIQFQLKPKEKAKYLAEIASQCKRLGKFTQSFAVGVTPVFDDKVMW